MSEEDNAIYPSIDPSVFDLIVVGTGLPESIIAAAASVAEKTVLHVDSNSFYGSHFSSLSLDDFTSFLHAQKTQPETTLPHSSVVNGSNGDKDYVIIDLKPKSLYSDIKISSLPEEESVKSCSRKFNLDLSGPRVMFCADSVVNLLLNSGGKHHIEFKSIDGSFIYGANGEFSAVPDSRSCNFQRPESWIDREESVDEVFFKLVQAHIEELTEHAEDSDESRRIRDEDLESPFIEFLNKQRLPSKIKSMILYAIAMADYDQEKPELRSLCKVLRLPVIALLLSKENGDCKGIRLASGQEMLKCSESDDKGEVIEKVARGIRHTNTEECSVSSIRVLQLGSGLAVCPSGMSVLYLSTLRDNAIQGRKSLHAAMNFLLAPPLSENPQDIPSIQSEMSSPLYCGRQHSSIAILQASSGGGITSWPAPDGNLDYRNILESSDKRMQIMILFKFKIQYKRMDHLKIKIQYHLLG
ncbi:hypothetical protein MKX03_029640 [Papaver bracteatum]|nr:hypothetical protein MKX03_029640 [Papaver bracteatum]